MFDFEHNYNVVENVEINRRKNFYAIISQEPNFMFWLLKELKFLKLKHHAVFKNTSSLFHK